MARMTQATDPFLGTSFRDPCGFVFENKGVLYRQINEAGLADYQHLMDSGLSRALTRAGLLVAHEEMDPALAVTDEARKVIKPERVPLVSYPYEWCFGQLKDAALATLAIQRIALAHGASLKDASAFNIQFVGRRPLLIDTLSLERYREGEPWIAYRQFCEHFVAPLALMAHRDPRLSKLLQVDIQGIGLDLATGLLGIRTRLSPRLLIHLRLHARSQRRHAGEGLPGQGRGRFGKLAFMGLIDSLESTVKKLQLTGEASNWKRYYSETNYQDAAFLHKQQLVTGWLSEVSPGKVWDLGANVGLFSRLASVRGIETTAFDYDHACVEACYQRCKRETSEHLLPLWVDLVNPTPAVGWDNRERQSLFARGPADLAMALALVHHMAIGNNVPLPRLAKTFAHLGQTLIVEFVPKSDSQVKRLLASRQDIFPDYTRDGFEHAFSKVFELAQRAHIEGSERILYLMRPLGRER